LKLSARSNEKEPWFPSFMGTSASYSPAPVGELKNWPHAVARRTAAIRPYAGAAELADTAAVFPERRYRRRAPKLPRD
jgi:hypothetical protein